MAYFVFLCYNTKPINDKYFDFFLFVSGVPIIEGDTVRLPKWIGLSHSLVLIMTVRLAGAKKHLNVTIKLSCCYRNMLAYLQCNKTLL